MKIAYPNYPGDEIAQPVYNINKWVETMRNVYASIYAGSSYDQAVKANVSDWNRREIAAFQTWMNYYKSGNDQKYKKAANMYMSENIPGYFLPNPKLPEPIAVPDNSNPINTVVKQFVDDKAEKAEKKKVIEDQRKKIIGRLNAAVKHLTQYEGHLLAGDEFNRLLNSMYDLIKEFQTVNKVSLSNATYNDRIIREANKLEKSGLSASSSFLKKFAQNSQGNLPLGGAVPISPPAAPVNPTAPSPAPLLTPESVNPAPAIPPAPVEKPKKEKTALEKLLDNIDTSGLTDSNKTEDENESEDGELEVELDEPETVLWVSAQAAPAAAPEAPAPAPAAPRAPASPGAGNGDLEVSLDGQDNSEVDALLDNAFKNITVEDLIGKLESVNSIFSNRTISKELSTIDLMANYLGLSSYLNSISEIISKNNDASNYVQSRMIELINTLRGASSKSELDLTAPDNAQSPQTQAVQQALRLQKEKEDNRKQTRKEMDDAGLDKTPAPAAPEMNIQELNNTPAPKVV